MNLHVRIQQQNIPKDDYSIKHMLNFSNNYELLKSYQKNEGFMTIFDAKQVKLKNPYLRLKIINVNLKSGEVEKYSK